MTEDDKLPNSEPRSGPASPDLRTTPVEGKLPRIAIAVCCYHLMIFIVALLAATFYLSPDSLVQCTSSNSTGIPPNSAGPALAACTVVHGRVLLLAILFGALGSTLSASRVVVLALRYRNYQIEKAPWQLLTPIHGSVLAVMGIYVIFGGLLALARSPSLSDNFGYFVGGFSFIVGFSSELFVKRLIRATEALFGESDSENIEGVATRDKTEQKKGP